MHSYVYLLLFWIKLKIVLLKNISLNYVKHENFHLLNYVSLSNLQWFLPFSFWFLLFSTSKKKKHHSPNEISILYITQTMEWIFYIVKGYFSLHKLFFVHFLESILVLFVLGKSEILCFCVKRNVYSISYMKTFLVFNKHMILKLPALFYFCFIRL